MSHAWSAMSSVASGSARNADSSASCAGGAQPRGERLPRLDGLEVGAGCHHRVVHPSCSASCSASRCRSPSAPPSSARAAVLGLHARDVADDVGDRPLAAGRRQPEPIGARSGLGGEEIQSLEVAVARGAHRSILALRPPRPGMHARRNPHPTPSCPAPRRLEACASPCSAGPCFFFFFYFVQVRIAIRFRAPLHQRADQPSQARPRARRDPGPGAIHVDAGDRPPAGRTRSCRRSPRAATSTAPVRLLRGPPSAARSGRCSAPAHPARCSPGRPGRAPDCRA